MPEVALPISLRDLSVLATYAAPAGWRFDSLEQGFIIYARGDERLRIVLNYGDMLLPCEQLKARVVQELNKYVDPASGEPRPAATSFRPDEVSVEQHPEARSHDSGSGSACPKCSSNNIDKSAQRCRDCGVTSKQLLESMSPAAWAASRKLYPSYEEGASCIDCRRPFSAYRQRFGDHCGDCAALMNPKTGAPNGEPKRRHPHTPSWPSHAATPNWED